MATVNDARAAGTELPNSPLFDDETPFATMMASFDEAAKHLGLKPMQYLILRKSDREISVSVPVKLDDGSWSVYDGFRIQHNQGLGPFIGPLRLTEDLRIDELRALAAWMTWKCSLLGIPFGGAAGGIRLDARSLSAGELERAVRRYTANLLGDIGPDRDVISPDLYAHERINAWILDTVSNHERHTASSAVTGKPIELSGTLAGEDSVARGLRTILRLAAAHFGIGRPLSVIIQGAGTVGGNLARILHSEGHRVVGMSDVHGGFYDARGLDVPALLAWKANRGGLAGCPGDFDRISNEELLTRRCSVLVPCAVANAIHSNNAESIGAELVVEGAHGPVSVRADRILERRGIPVVPDILANGGGVVASYFEWVQNRTGLQWIEDLVDRRLVRFMREAWDAVSETRKRYDVSLRMAANIMAVDRVARADEQRGIYA